jgi:hypothetical protein
LKAADLAAKIVVSRRTIFSLKKRFPADAPADMVDLVAWKKFVNRHLVNVPASYRFGTGPGGDETVRHLSVRQ